ncbi:MAG: hypothetical protein A2X59_07800 [Nitrospirae bacterium GWC2_42_7]|nr:MAG: hypothetical protein A2X59_07800 [Nitrospirae bacterium GWC2_42_7]
MEASYITRYHTLEDTHWWFLGRRDMIRRLIREFPKSSEILEVGCSGGPMMEILRDDGFTNITGIDINEKAVDICRKKGLNDVMLASGEDTGLEDQHFDVIIASDVIEHIQQETMALTEWKRILKKSGKLFIFVPAFNFLWSAHDTANIHYRRYSKKSLAEILQSSGFIIERISYWNFILFFPVCIARLFQRIFCKSGNKRGGQLHRSNSLINKILESIIKFENTYLDSGKNLPVGISLFAIAKKR